MQTWMTDYTYWYRRKLNNPKRSKNAQVANILYQLLYHKGWRDVVCSPYVNLESDALPGIDCC